MSADKNLIPRKNPERLLYQSFHSVNGLNVTTAFIQPKSGFINIFLQMFNRNGMISADNTSFQHRPDAFNSIRVDIPVFDIIPRAMIHIVMLIADISKIVIRGKFIGIYSRTLFNILLKPVEKSIGLSVIDNSGNNTTVSLNKAENSRLTGRTATSMTFLL